MIKKKKNTIAIILARGGSKGIPNKNIKSFLGKPLLVWTIIQARMSSKRLPGKVLMDLGDKKVLNYFLNRDSNDNKIEAEAPDVTATWSTLILILYLSR